MPLTPSSTGPGGRVRDASIEPQSQAIAAVGARADSDLTILSLDDRLRPLTPLSVTRRR
jgi:hypothetical protein